MPPKKTSSKAETAPRRRLQSKEKPKLKTPTVLKIKLPLKNLVKTVHNIESPNSDILNKKCKDLTSSEKLELTNKVARAQLNKSEPVIFSPPPETEQKIKVVKKRGRKKVVEVANNCLEASGSHDAASSEPICTNTPVNSQTPKRKRKNPVKTDKVLAGIPEKEMLTKLEVDPIKKMRRRPLKRKLVNPTEENINPPKKKWTQSTITGMKILVRRNSKADPNGCHPRTVTLTKPKIIRKRAPRGKKNVGNPEESPQGSPTLTQTEIGNYTIKKDEQKRSKNASAVDSRKTSVTSELSWTKDISDSSNTTSLIAVTSSDFVLIDKKLPEMKLTKIDSLAEYKRVYKESKPTSLEIRPKTPSDSSSSSDSDSSDSENSSKCNSYKASDIASRHSLNLSVSSESHRSPIITQRNININTMNSNVTKISKALDKLSMSLKKIDLEMINWVGYQNKDINVNGKKIREKIYQNLKEESNIIVQCRHINKLLTDKEDIDEKNVTENVEDKSNRVFVKPSDVVPKTLNRSGDHSNFVKGNHSREQIDYSDTKYDTNEKFTSDKALHTPFDQYNDDEDALSLYADSIGFESNRNSISSPPVINPEIEEYIPQPIVKNMSPTNIIIYNPTKITNNQVPIDTSQNVRPVTTVCEKQNADSTSVVREASQHMNGRVEGIEKLPEPKVIRPVNIQARVGPCLLATIFKPAPGVKSIVFKGMCFFHLIRSCKIHSRCRFPHVEPSPLDITTKLIRLSEDMFIQEYMLLKCWPGLRRKYAVCFVDECKRRDLTRLLVEMAIDFVIKANGNSQEDVVLKVYVQEEALLHLNNIDLNTCEDLLKYVIQCRQLCDIFMETIANTQNFSRFKPVFTKLTEFMIGNGKHFTVDVASHILERVAILPFNESLAWALLSIMKNTDAVIFENPMMVQFEKQLASNEGLQREFLAVKEMAGLNQPVVGQAFNPVGLIVRQDVERPLASPRYTSPDTTHLDSMNKPPDEPIITRSIHFDRSFPNHSSSSSEGTEDSQRKPKPNSLFKSWRHKTIFNKFSPQRFPIMRRMDQQVMYGNTSPKFPRGPVPDFF